LGIKLVPGKNLTINSPVRPVAEVVSVQLRAPTPVSSAVVAAVPAAWKEAAVA